MGGMYPPGGIYGNYSPFLPFQYGALSNPYTGYLSGVASVTEANGKYLIMEEQAKSLRLQNIRGAIDVRRRMEEEADWEMQRRRGNIERDRQHDQAYALERARHQPPNTEIWSGSALNVLLRNLIAQQGRGERGPKVPVNADVLKSVNVTSGSSRANTGLLRTIRDRGKLSWPVTLQDVQFNDARDKLDADLARAVGALKLKHEVDPGTIKDLRANLQLLNNQLRAAVGDLTPQQYVEAKRYLNTVGDAIRVFDDPTVATFFNPDWASNARTVGDLVKFMNDNGLQFAAAVPGDEPAYTTLYQALASYDAGMTQVAASDRTPSR